MYGGEISPINIARQGVDFFSAYLFENSLPPLAASVQLTNRCNKNCSVCFESEKESKDIDFEVIKKIVNGLDRNGILFLTGGEPFLHPEIWKILGYLKKKEVNFTICTNGSLLDAENVAKLMNLSPNSIIFSIHGFRELHDKEVGSKSSFRGVEKAIKELKKREFGGKIIVNTVITSNNYHQLTEIAENFKNIKVDALRFQHLSFLREEEFRKMKKELRDSVEYYIGNPKIDLIHLKNEIEKVRKVSAPVFFIPDLNKSDIETWYSREDILNKRCLFIHRGLYVDSGGVGHSCQVIRNKIGDLKEKSLYDVFNSKKAKIFRKNRKKKLCQACIRCCKL